MAPSTLVATLSHASKDNYTMARRRGKLNFTPRRRGSGRTLALSAIFFVLALTIAPPIQHYFTQRAQINSLRAQVSSDTKALQEAQKELQLWRDPEYIKSQARERLHFVLPGERQYIVTDSTSRSAQEQSTLVADNVPDNQPWYTRLIASITETGSK
jgi:cell division protein FtsB